MSGWGLFEIWLTAFFTLALFSFLYRDNPIYKVAEHIFAGLTAGYQVGLVWDTIIVIQLWEPLLQGGLWLFVPGILGVLMFFRLWPRNSWISRTPLAFVFGVTSGIFLISQLHGLVLPQMQNTMEPITRVKSEVVSGYDINADVFEMQATAGVSQAPVDTIPLDSLARRLEAAPTVPTAGDNLTVREGTVGVDPPISVLGVADSLVLTGTFVDPDLSRLDMYRVGWTLRSERGQEIKALSPLADEARLRRGAVAFAEHGNGAVAVRYTWPVDTSIKAGTYDLMFEVQRDRVMVILTIIVVIGVLSTLLYFYFSHEHKGALGAVARVGVWFIMVSFGAHFGYTVMGRVSLLIGRVQFLVEDWIGTIF